MLVALMPLFYICLIDLSPELLNVTGISEAKRMIPDNTQPMEVCLVEVDM